MGTVPKWGVAYVSCLMLVGVLFAKVWWFSFYSVQRMRSLLPAAWAVVGSAILTRNGRVQGEGEREGKRKERGIMNECVESQGN